MIKIPLNEAMSFKDLHNRQKNKKRRYILQNDGRHRQDEFTSNLDKIIISKMSSMLLPKWLCNIEGHGDEIFGRYIVPCFYIRNDFNVHFEINENGIEFIFLMWKEDDLYRDFDPIYLYEIKKKDEIFSAGMAKDFLDKIWSCKTYAEIVGLFGEMV